MKNDFRPRLANLYKRQSVLEKMTLLLGPQNANLWFNTSASQLDRGHLAAKGDFAYASQQYATFYYLNASPQFHAFNSINWLRLEKSVRVLASNNGTIDVYTGIKDVLKLNNERSNLVDVYLDDRNQLPVPQYFWKVVQVQATNQKFAFVGFNNPINAAFTNQDRFYQEHFCLENCGNRTFSWLVESLNVESRDPLKGIVLCCLYNDDFKRKTRITLPTIEIEIS